MEDGGNRHVCCRFSRRLQEGRGPRAPGAKNKTEAIDGILSSALIRPRQGRQDGEGGWESATTVDVVLGESE